MWYDSGRSRGIMKAATVRFAFPAARLCFATLLCAAFVPSPALADIIYVSPSGSHTGSFTNWAEAATNLQDAIAVAVSNDQIWVAAGTYVPGTTRGNTFLLKEWVDVYGGFSGTETNLNDRDWVANQTILDGDINGDDIGVLNNSENVYSVVVGNDNATLDGFTIRGGNSNSGGNQFGGGLRNIGTAPTVRNCMLTENTANYGGGMHNDSASPTIENCSFVGNHANMTGGGLYNNSVSRPTLTNCVFSGNWADAVAGGIHNSGPSSNVIVNCTIVGNWSANDGGGIHNSAGSVPLIVKNCIVWNNSVGGATNESTQIDGLPPATRVDYSCIQGLTGGFGGTGNIGDDPLFLDITDAKGPDGICGSSDDGLRLTGSSPCVNTATNAGAPATDIRGLRRPYGAGVDMGAYELGVVYVDIDAAGADNGTSWTDAYTNLQDALTVTNMYCEVWVAEGTYIPGTDSNATFQLIESISLCGGFDGTETNRSQRSWTDNLTILSGDINGDDAGFSNNTENAFHVVTGADHAVIDGFEITGGNALAPEHGGGMCNRLCANVTVENCVFAGNNADKYGAGIYNNGSVLTVRGCTFSGNYTAGEGGGIYSTGTLGTVTHSVFSGNQSMSGGGGIHRQGSRGTIRNTVFCGNYGGDGSGALRNFASTTAIESCTLNLNYGAIGAGIDNYAEGGLTISNSIIRNNGWYQIATGNDSSTTVAYSDIYDDEIGGGIWGPITYGNGIVWEDPLLVGGQTGSTWTAEAAATPNRFLCVLADTNAAWTPGALVGKFVEPDIGEVPAYIIVSNSATALWVRGDVLGGSLTGITYRIHDCHLKSTVGHWETGAKAWSNDLVVSPAIDAGDPASAYANEPWSNGERINMGAYGNTAEASKSPLTVLTLAASDKTYNSATLNGQQTSTGCAEDPYVVIHWGPTDGGTNVSLWTNHIDMGQLSVGYFSSNITNLAAGTYYFRAWASNSTGIAWAPMEMYVIVGDVDLVVTKKVDQDKAYPADPLVFTITVTNLGPDTATGVRLQDLCPPYVSFDSASPSQGSYNFVTDVWTVNTLASNASATLTISASAELPVTLVNVCEPDPVFGPGSLFGCSACSIGDSLFAVGAQNTDAPGFRWVGAVYLFDTNGALQTTITNPIPTDFDDFGVGVAAVGRDLLAVGDSRDDSQGTDDAGIVYLYNTNGVLLVTITNPTPEIDDLFGVNIAAVGTDRLLISAYWDNPGGLNNAGSVYLYSTNGTLLVTITNPAPEVGDLFGSAVACVGDDLLVVGARDDDPGGLSGCGSAYIYNTNGTLLTTITNPTPDWSEYFGKKVCAIDDERFLIGATGDKGSGSVRHGSAYLYDTNGTLLVTVTNPLPASSDNFGDDLGGLGVYRFIVGARADDVNGFTEAGSFFLYDMNGALLGKFPNPAPENNDYLGCAVASIGDDLFLIGAFGDDPSGINGGAAYLYRLGTAPRVMQTNTVLLANVNQTDRSVANDSAAAKVLIRTDDIDRDGMSDGWEQQHYGSWTNGQAASDGDGDGHNTLQEYLADTVPTNGASVLLITDISTNAGGNRIDWQGGVLVTQFVERCDSLTDTGATWTAIVTNNPPTPVTTNYVDVTVTNAAGFYRIRATRP